MEENDRGDSFSHARVDWKNQRTKSERKFRRGTKRRFTISIKSGKKINGEAEEQSISVPRSLGIERKFAEVQETVEQSFSDSRRYKKGEREEKIKKKARRSEGQRLTEKENERKKRTHKHVRKRSRSKGRCEPSEERGKRSQY